MLQTLMLGSGLQPSVVQEATEHLVAKALLLCLGDKSEACREAAATLLIGLLQVCRAQLAVLPSPTMHWSKQKHSCCRLLLMP